MRYHPFFLRKVNRALCAGSSYSIVCASVVSFVFLVWAVSCGPAPKGQYHVPETALAAAAKTVPEPSAQTTKNLPEAATINLREMPYIRNIFKQPLRIDRGGLDDFYATTRGKVQHIAIISNTSLDVLQEKPSMWENGMAGYFNRLMVGTIGETSRQVFHSDLAISRR